MSDLKKLFGELGFSNIITYIQSGNVIFDSKSTKNNIELANNIEQIISRTYGFEVQVIVRTVPELQRSIAANPFLEVQDIEIEGHCLTFLKSLPSKEKLDNIRGFDFSPDKFEIIDKDVFIYCSGRYSDSKLTNKFFESKLNVLATTRNWKTVRKLFELT